VRVEPERLAQAARHLGGVARPRERRESLGGEPRRERRVAGLEEDREIGRGEREPCHERGVAGPVERGVGTASSAAGAGGAGAAAASSARAPSKRGGRFAL